MSEASDNKRVEPQSAARYGDTLAALLARQDLQPLQRLDTDDNGTRNYRPEREATQVAVS